MTPPINSVSDERLARIIKECADADGVLVGGWRFKLDYVTFSDMRSILTELAARRAANTPVDGWVYLVHDWEINDPGQRGYSYARTPERAERLAKNGVKLTPVYTRHPASEFVPASPALPSQVVEGEFPTEIWAGDFDAQGYGHAVAGMQGGLYERYVLATSCLTSPAAGPVAWRDAYERLVNWLLRYPKFTLGDLEQLERDLGPFNRESGPSPTVAVPAPSASREVTVTDEMLFAAMQRADELDVIFDDIDGREILRAALLAALPEREV